MIHVSPVVEAIIGSHEDMLDPVLVQAADAWYASNNEGIRRLILEHVGDGIAAVERVSGRELQDHERDVIRARIAQKLAEFVITASRTQ